MRSITVALTTFRESVRQPAFYALLVLGVLLLVFGYLLPTFTAGADEVKFVRDIGLGTFTLCIILLGIFSSANLITTEIENKTAMTVMSKPLRRYEFIIGKYLGIVLAVLLLSALLTAVFVPTIVAKVLGGNIVEVSSDGNKLSDVWPNVSVIIPGLVLGIFEALVLVAVSVALSIRLPMILNVVISFGLFLTANVSGRIVEYLSAHGAGAGSLYVARVFYYLLPNFQANVETYSAIGLNLPVSGQLVAWTIIYSVFYIGAALGVAVFLFQDRELG